MKPLKDLRFMAKQIDPSELAIVINETNIKIILANEVGAGPHTSEKTSSRGALDTLVDFGYGS